MRYISTLVSAIFFSIVAVILMLVIFTPKCQHEERRYVYTFNSRDNTSPDYIGYRKKYCKNCEYYFGNTYFYGAPEDTSYLDLIREHTDGDGLVDGEYYIMSAIVTFGYYTGNKISINCKIENEDITVAFSVRFREEFKEEVILLKQGDEITFRGKFVEMGCDWTDCDLL